MLLTRVAVARPITTLMCCLVLVLLGGLALQRLAVDLLPDIANPSVSVVTVYEGAGPEELETLITRPMEQALSAVHGVEQIDSTSLEGSSNLRIRFEWGTNLDVAIGEMRAIIERLRRGLPDGIEPPYIRRFDINSSPIMYLGLSSTLGETEITEVAEQQIIPRLERIDGVASARLRGGVRREIQVDVDRAKLEALNMAVNEVVDALRRENVNQPAGDFEEGNVNLLIRSRGEFRSLEEISNTVMRQRDGAVVRVRDVADVVDGLERRTELTRVNGKPGLMVYIQKQSGANTVAVSDSVHRAIRELNASNANFTLAVRLDKSEFIRQSIRNIQISAGWGMLLSVAVLVLFLHSFRSTLIIAVSMPLSVLATFVLIYANGFTLNIVSFGGLALGIGMLVDNSIVVLESIFRKREEGLSPTDAAITGTGEVGGAIVASTITTLIVFVPLMYISGTTSILLVQLASVVSFSLVCSLGASLTLTPALAAHWLAKSGVEGSPAEVRSRFSPSRWFHTVNRAWLQGLETGYARALRTCLRHRVAVAITLTAALGMSLGLLPRIGTEFLPKVDEGDLRVYGRMAPGIQLETLDRQAHLIAHAVDDAVTETVAIGTFIGGDKDDADEWNEVNFNIKLPARDKRVRGIEDIRDALADRIGPVPGMTVNVRASTDMMLFRRLTGSGADLAVRILGHDLATADQLAEQVAAVMAETPGLVNVEVQQEDRRPELAASIDRVKASVIGVRVDDIAQTLETTIRGTEATVYREAGDEFNVRVQLRAEDRNQLPDIQQVGIATPSGRILPLRNLVSFGHGDSPVSINRYNRQRIKTVTCDVDDVDLGTAVRSLSAGLQQIPTPTDFSLNIAGDWEQQQESFASLQSGLILAIVLMYMVMASQFESLRNPLLILVSVPLALIGVVLVLVLTETTLNVQSFIGLVMLAGIVVNNAIVLVDYMNLLRHQRPDLPIDELAVTAAVRRFRPIIMTTLTTVLAMIPIALGWGDGGELQSPMARVVIGGMLSGTLITLIAIPLIYATVERDEPQPSTERLPQ